LSRRIPARFRQLRAHRWQCGTRTHSVLCGVAPTLWLLLALTLLAYALAMTIGRGSFGPLNMVLRLVAVVGVGPFYLSRALALDAAHVGLVMSSGPIVVALTGVPAGRIVDRFGAHRMSIGGLIGSAATDITTARPEAVATGR
jgi:MFS family permease